jgi:hypothetical protein
MLIVKLINVIVKTLYIVKTLNRGDSKTAARGRKQKASLL